VGGRREGEEGGKDKGDGGCLMDVGEGVRGGTVTVTGRSPNTVAGGRTSGGDGVAAMVEFGLEAEAGVSGRTGVASSVAEGAIAVSEAGNSIGISVAPGSRGGGAIGAGAIAVAGGVWGDNRLVAPAWGSGFGGSMGAGSNVGNSGESGFAVGVGRGDGGFMG
jgi:hypothetical protein